MKKKKKNTFYVTLNAEKKNVEKVLQSATDNFHTVFEDGTFESKTNFEVTEGNKIKSSALWT